MDAIDVNGLTKSFGPIEAVKGLTLRIRSGEIYGLVGPDGAGKTTTMRLLTGSMDPTSGDAFVGGHHTVRDAERIKEEIGYMAQRFGLYPDLTVAENIHFYAEIYGVPRRGREERIEELLSFSNMKPFKKRLAGNLSGGMKQKLGLVCALIHTPKVLFLDEPTNGVDPVSRRDFWRILNQLQKDGVTILVSTAYLDEAERCTRVGLLHQGRLIAEGTPDELKGLLQGVILEVTAEQPRAAAATLRKAGVSPSVGLFGDRIHVVAQDPRQATDAIEAALAADGLVLSGIRQKPPSLEDVFISVLGQRSAGATDVAA
jgi:ABC-2 type transport system ATP-binding protein